MIKLTTDAKLVARNGRVIHATAPNCQGVALCSENMASKGYAPVLFAELADRNAPVTCKNCCRKLGIEAPKEISIHREEVFRRIKEENQKAATGKDGGEAHLGALSDLFKKK